jgi:large subunit ribosomal protein L32e
MAEKKETKKTAKETPKPKAEKKIVKKDKAFLKARRLLKKKHLPLFRGRFGVKSIRKKSIEKWQKWRRPRGEDVQRNQEDGARPGIGYGSRKEIRFLHPSGYKEVLVKNQKELVGLKDCIVRIAATIGKRKRKLIIAEAKKAGLKIAN